RDLGDGMSRLSNAAMLIAVGLMCTWMLVASYALTLPIWFYLPGIIVSAGLVGISISERKQQLANSALSRSREEVRRLARMAERERIARDLHDVLGHTLSVITLKAELAGKLVDSDPERAREEMAEVAATSREALASVRETVGNYRRVGLSDEIHTARQSLKRAGVALVTHVDDVSLSPRHETLLALIVREATTNVIRHAGASECELTLQRADGEITLVIADNGQGFDGGEGQGMTGMRERLAVLGGTLHVAGHNGTTLTIRVPESLSS
ncbi:MAG: sensor histidine kinase, partial [Pseudomonadota bacterium]